MFLDVIAGPMIAMLAGIYIILPALLIALVVFITVKLVKKLKNKHKEEDQ